MARTRELVDAAIERLRGAGSETPRLDAELLLAFAIGVDRTAIIAHGDTPVGADAEATFEDLVSRRAGGEPVAYLRGMKEFHGIALTVDRRALIPRPETEELVDQTIGEVMTRLTAAVREAPLRVVDVGTGSGAIAVSVAVALRARRVPTADVSIVAVDADLDALNLARENAVAHGVGDRMAFQEADLLPGDTGRRWDIVAANLPYLRSDVVDALERQRLSPAFEPRRALDGGPDGLTVIGRLLEQLPDALADDGAALLEIGADQGEAMVELAADRLPGWACMVIADLAGLPRIARLAREAGQPG